MQVFALGKLAKFQPGKMAKVDLVNSPQLVAGLHCFEPGQSHQPHAHPGADKLYWVVEGSGEFSLGEERRTLQVGELLHVPEGVPHGVANAGSARLVVAVVIAPNPHATS